MSKKYTKQELIDELHRFKRENGRNPTKRDMNHNNGYISQNAYYSYFGSWDVALQAANLRLNRGYANKEFLINELKRFYDIYNRSPTINDMGKSSGFPSIKNYYVYFNSWNEALKEVGLQINKTNEMRTGTETCCVCGNYKKENQQWITKGLPEGEVICTRCYKDPDYMKGNLNINISTGFAFVTQRIVANVLKLELKNDCNCSIGFNHPFDLYDDGRYSKINVKSAAIINGTSWIFNMRNVNIPDTYICLGFNKDRKNIEHVWIVDAFDDFVYNKQSFTITNGINSLNNHKYYEVDPKPYNEVYHSMSLVNCEYLRSD